MKATHIVINSAHQAIGYLIDNTFYTDYIIQNDISYIDNLSLTKYGKIHPLEELPETTYQQAVQQRQYEKLQEENPFIRDIQKELSEWKENRLHKVLQLEGPRQTGKTTELLKFAYKNYEYVIYVNIFNDNYGFKEGIIEQDVTPLEMEKYCRRARLPHYVDNQSTILIIDEIQVNPTVYNAIRTMKAQLNCDIIVTGSYLGQTLKKEYFQPAGTISCITMYPLSFCEFCRIFGKKENLQNIDLYGTSGKEEYEELYQLYDIYRQIGGYPEVVKTYLATQSIDASYEVISNLLRIFEKESRNYFSDSKETLLFQNVYIEALKEMCNEKKGTGSRLVETVTKLVKESQKQLISRDEVSNAIQWLIYSGMIGECNLCNNGDINDISMARRLYYMDCGIAAYIASQSTIDKTSIEGFLTENFVYDELHRLYTQRFSIKKVKGILPCFSIYGTYELDFIIVGKDNTIYGLEVKTKRGDTKSLKVFLDKRFVDRGIVVRKTVGGHSEQFDTIPVYAVGARFPYP